MLDLDFNLNAEEDSFMEIYSVLDPRGLTLAELVDWAHALMEDYGEETKVNALLFDSVEKDCAVELEFVSSSSSVAV